MPKDKTNKPFAAGEDRHFYVVVCNRTFYSELCDDEVTTTRETPFKQKKNALAYLYDRANEFGKENEVDEKDDYSFKAEDSDGELVHYYLTTQTFYD